MEESLSLAIISVVLSLHALKNLYKNLTFGKKNVWEQWKSGLSMTLPSEISHILCLPPPDNNGEEKCVWEQEHKTNSKFFLKLNFSVISNLEISLKCATMLD